MGWRDLHNDTPHLVYSKLALTQASRSLCAKQKRLLEARSDNQGNDGSSELANSLHSKHSIHHSTSTFCSRKLRCDNRRQWVVTTDSNTLTELALFTPLNATTHHENTPKYDDTSDGNSSRVGRESLSKSREDNDDQFESIHALSSNDVCEVSESQLAEDSSSGCSDLDGGVGAGGDGAVGLAAVEVDDAQHGRYQVDGENLALLVLSKE